MKVVIAPDSFKESAAAPDVAAAIAEGWRRVSPRDELVLAPMADGGEGTVDALVSATGGRHVRARVTGPLGNVVSAQYGVLGDNRTAVIEMAAASGLPLVPPDRRDPRFTTTKGTGDMLRHAIDAGMREIIIGIGGSATNDGGAGMARALGYRFLDADGGELPPGGAALARLAKIDTAGRHPGLNECRIRVACDVDNKLCGRYGAAKVFGPQKGASPATAKELDAAMLRFGRVVEAQLGVPVLNIRGGGAAGGLGAGLVAFAGATLESGVALVAEACGLADMIRDADLVITGEGKIDAQSAGGKTPVGVASIAKRLNVPVIAFAGALGEGYQGLCALGLDAIFGICPAPMSIEQAMAETEKNLANTAENVARTFQIFKRFSRGAAECAEKS
jgi:glycerate kinase